MILQPPRHHVAMHVNSLALLNGESLDEGVEGVVCVAPGTRPVQMSFAVFSIAMTIECIGAWRSLFKTVSVICLHPDVCWLCRFARLFRSWIASISLALG